MILTQKRSGLAFSLATAALLCANSAAAAPLNLSDGDIINLSYSNGANGDRWGGGEFQASGVSVAYGPGDPFFTFCLEYTEHFSPGSNYYVRINTGAVNGGASNAATYSGDVGGTTNFDPISKATAWLYTQFVNNASGLGYEMSGTNNQASGSTNQALNDSFQLAIWKLEGELQGAALTAYNGTDILATTAQQWVDDAINGSASWTDIGNVRVMNLYSDAALTNRKQDQLYMAVPEPGSFALLGIALAGLGCIRRKQKSV